MKEIVFRPLRRLKSGKIAVASYAQWRKIKVADRSKFKLVVSGEYKEFPANERVHNHLGENLFWKEYNPGNIPVLVGQDRPKPYPKMWKTDYGMYSAFGLDCDGVPAFSHYTPSHCASFSSMEDFMPLTAGMIQWWVGWFLYQLENTDLEVVSK